MECQNPRTKFFFSMYSRTLFLTAFWGMFCRGGSKWQCNFTHNCKQVVNRLKIPQGLSTLLFHQWSEVSSRGIILWQWHLSDKVENPDSLYKLWWLVPRTAPVIVLIASGCNCLIHLLILLYSYPTQLHNQKLARWRIYTYFRVTSYWGDVCRNTSKQSRYDFLLLWI